MTFIDTWAAAIQEHEGYVSDPPSRSFRNRNPGNLQFAGQRGAVGHDDKGFAIFDEYADGLEALKRQLAKYVRDFPDYTIQNIMAHYLGNPDPLNPAVTDQGDPFSYAEAVAKALGVPASTSLSALDSNYD